MANSKSGLVSMLIGPISQVPGWQEPVYLADAAAGTATVTHTIDGPEWERLVTLAVKLSTSAAGSSRYLACQIKDVNGNTFVDFDLSTAVSVSSNVHAYAAPGMADHLEGSGISSAPMPDLLLPPGWSWNIEVVGVDAADLLTDMCAIVHKFTSDNVKQYIP